MRSLPEVFQTQCQTLGQANAFYFFDQNRKKWRYLTWNEYLAQVIKVATWLDRNGIRRGDKVGILSANRPEWMIADLAIMWVGAVSVPVYATSSDKDIKFIADHSDAKIFVVDHAERAHGLRGTTLEAVVFFDQPSTDEVEFLNAKIYSFTEILATHSQLIENPVAVDSEDIATMVYTSGTTGNPKGVMHSHGNLCSVGKVVAPVLKVGSKGKDRMFSFLPLSHVAERVLIQIGSIYTGTEVAFARSVANLFEDLLECRPSILLCVPRLWEKIYEKIEIGLSNGSLIRRPYFKFAQWLGSSRIHHGVAEKKKNIWTILSDLMVGRSLRAKLGLDRARTLVTGSAPTRPDVMLFFASFGLFIREVYGLTENLCLGTYNLDGKLLIGSCGVAFPGNEIKIANDEEILFRSSWNFKGYYKDEAATREALSGENWFSTGDLGSLDQNGYLKIVGRKKELLKTSTGKFVAPVPIEDKIKALPFIQDAMLVGDNEKYCVALISIDKSSCGSDFQNRLIEHLNVINQDLAHHESVKRLGVLREPFSVEAGTLTPTLKVKRKIAFTKSQNFIQKIYTASEVLVFE